MKFKSYQFIKFYTVPYVPYRSIWNVGDWFCSCLNPDCDFLSCLLWRQNLQCYLTNDPRMFKARRELLNLSSLAQFKFKLNLWRWYIIIIELLQNYLYPSILDGGPGLKRAQRRPQRIEGGPPKVWEMQRTQKCEKRGEKVKKKGALKRAPESPPAPLIDTLVKTL